MSKGSSIQPQLKMVSTLPWPLEQTGLSKLVRRIDRVTLYTFSMKPAAIDTLLSEMRSVSFIDHLFIGDGNISDEQIVDLVSDLSIHELTVRNSALRASDGRWLQKNELKTVSLMGEQFSNADLLLLPTSIERIQIFRRPTDDVSAASFERFTQLKEITFYYCHEYPSLLERTEGLGEVPRQLSKYADLYYD